MYKTINYNYQRNILQDELEQKSIDIINEELDAAYKDLITQIATGHIPTIDEIKNKGREATKRSIERICVAGAKDKLNNYMPYLIGGSAILLIYLLAK